MAICTKLPESMQTVASMESLIGDLIIILTSLLSALFSSAATLKGCWQFHGLLNPLPEAGRRNGKRKMQSTTGQNGPRGDTIFYLRRWHISISIYIFIMNCWLAPTSAPLILWGTVDLAVCFFLLERVSIFKAWSESWSRLRWKRHMALLQALMQGQRMLQN